MTMLFLILLSVFSADPSLDEHNLRSVRWVTSLAEAREAASRAGKPLLVEFGAKWCGFCKKLDRETFSQESVVRFVNDSFVAVQIDVDKEPELARKYEIGGLPTVVFLSPGGEVLARLEGFRPPDTFLLEARKSAETSAALQKIQKLAEKAPGDVAAQRTHARALCSVRNFDGAIKVLEAAKSAIPAGSFDANLLLDLGDTYRAAGNKAAARAAYGQLFTLKPEAAGEAREKAFLPLAGILLELRDSDGALGVLEELLKDPEKVRKERVAGLFLRAFVHAQRKDTERALADLKAARDEDPEGRRGQRAALIIETVETIK